MSSAVDMQIHVMLRLLKQEGIGCPEHIPFAFDLRMIYGSSTNYVF
jgi:hypothetical protein